MNQKHIHHGQEIAKEICDLWNLYTQKGELTKDGQNLHDNAEKLGSMFEEYPLWSVSEALDRLWKYGKNTRPQRRQILAELRASNASKFPSSGEREAQAPHTDILGIKHTIERVHKALYSLDVFHCDWCKAQNVFRGDRDTPIDQLPKIRWNKARGRTGPSLLLHNPKFDIEDAIAKCASDYPAILGREYPLTLTEQAAIAESFGHIDFNGVQNDMFFSNFYAMP